MAVYKNDPKVCPDCGKDNFQKRGLTTTRAGKYQRYVCKECGHWFRDGKNLHVHGSETMR